MLLSIVTGTYNRIGYLKRMVYSARNSIKIGLSYEITIVDGGSTDGTIDWCKKQLDVTLIEHGKLLGAVKAFNDGARQSRGTYVILANDDIEFVDESILCALSFMEDNHDVGIGCFYQDRYGKDWHVETMPVIRNGKQSGSPYGQVCIVPKWLGDKVGWWGDYLKTYGGDNELSCNVLELGYRIQEVPCACIKDLVADDNLRKVNNPDTKPGEMHPDSAKWYAKWRKGDLFGPVVANKLLVDNPIHTAGRVLYLPIYEKGFKAYKKGLRLSLAKKFYVVEYDYVDHDYPAEYMFDLCFALKPHILLTQIHDTRTFNVLMLKDLKKEFPGMTLVNWNGDYHAELLYDTYYMEMMREFDAVGLVTIPTHSEYNSINWFYWQIGYEESPVYASNSLRHQAVFLANGYSEERIQFAKYLRTLPYNIGIYGSWPKFIKPDGYTLYDFDAGYKLYKSSKIAISDSQWPQAKGFVSNRLFQAMYAGSLMMQQYFDGLEELLGLVHGKHLIVWHTQDELREYMRHYLSNDKDLERIAKAGQDYVIANHSFDMRVKELIAELAKI